jgi:uncharacterized protein (TIGR02996 family)
MSVHFVYRCHYTGPSGKHIVHFLEDDTVLAWFQRHWEPLADTEHAHERLEALLGCSVYGLGSLFEAIARFALPVPANNKQLAAYLLRYLYVEGGVWCRPHLIQALTDDDDLGMAYFFFDDHFLARHADRAAYLLTEGWQLPSAEQPRRAEIAQGFKPRTKTTRISLGGKGTGTTYAVLLSVYATDHLEHMRESYAFPATRLPQFARHLVRSLPEENTWPFELKVLRTQLLASPESCSATEEAFLGELRQQNSDDTPWLVYSDYLVEHGKSTADLTLLQRALERVTRFAPRWLNYTVDRSLFHQQNIEDARAAIDGLAAKVKGETHNPKLSSFYVEEHLAQLGLHAHKGGRRDEWHQWYFFDDLWASAQPAIAETLLRYGTRWDVLSAPSSEPLDR